MPILEKISSGLLGARAQQAQANAAYRGAAFRPEQELPQKTEAAGDRLCGAAGCSSAWVKPWKSRRRPIFEKDWACSARCLRAIVHTAVRRELGDGDGAMAEEPYRHRVPLGLVLLAQGWITHPQLQQALEAQRQSGHGRIGEWLAQCSGLGEEQITRGLGVQWSCPVLGADGFSPAAMALVMPKRFVAEFGMVPVRVAASKMMYIGFEDHLNAAAALGIEQMSGLKVESGLLSRTVFGAARTALLAADGVPATLSLVADQDELTARIAETLDQRQPVASKLVRVHQYYWLRTWLESGAFSQAGTLPASTEDVGDHLFLIGGSRTRSGGGKAIAEDRQN